jgi:hypothetical protein
MQLWLTQHVKVALGILQRMIFISVIDRVQLNLKNVKDQKLSGLQINIYLE